MTHKAVKIFFIVILFLLVLVGLFILHLWSGNWWHRPKFDKHVDKIVVYESAFRHAGSEPVADLSGDSSEGKKIIKAMQGGWFYWNIIKFGKDYTVDVIYKDEKVDSISVGNGFISVNSHDGDSDGVYKTKKRISELIRSQILQSSTTVARGAEGGSGSEESND